MTAHFKNPNNCDTCDYMSLNGNRGGYCYMFRHEPTDICLIHTGRDLSGQLRRELLAQLGKRTK